jgi:site-specific recombinase XerD
MIEEVMSEWREWMDAQDLSERTMAERISCIEQYFRFSGEKPMKMSPRKIIQFIGRETANGEKLARSTKATYHAHIRAYCAWLQRSGQRKDDPSAMTPRPKRKKSLPRPIRDNQLVSLLRAANRRRTRVFILLGALAGMRVHEIAKIHGRDIDLVNMTLTITGKGEKTAVIPLHPVLAEEALRWPRKGYWFPNYVNNRHGKAGTSHIRGHAVTQAIGDAMRRAGFDGKPHQLRHWFGSSLLNGGVDLRIVQELMRHSSPATTAIYTEVHIEQTTAGIHTLRVPVSIFGDHGEELPLAA